MLFDILPFLINVGNLLYKNESYTVWKQYVLNVINFVAVVTGIGVRPTDIPPFVAVQYYFTLDDGANGLRSDGTDMAISLVVNPDINIAVTGSGILFGTNQYGNFGELRDRCFGNPDLCYYGFTYAFWMRLSGNDDTWLMSSGGQSDVSWGISLAVTGGRLRVRGDGDCWYSDGCRNCYTRTVLSCSNIRRSCPSRLYPHSTCHVGCSFSVFLVRDISFLLRVHAFDFKSKFLQHYVGPSCTCVDCEF